MKHKIEVILIFSFLLLFSLVTIYPVLNILAVSIRTDNAFQTQSLSLIQSSESYSDLNNNDQWDPKEPYLDLNNNGKWDSGSSIKSYISLFTETDF